MQTQSGPASPKTAFRVQTPRKQKLVLMNQCMAGDQGCSLYFIGAISLHEQVLPLIKDQTDEASQKEPLETRRLKGEAVALICTLLLFKWIFLCLILPLKRNRSDS